jgi:hypothetical protein
VAKRLVYTSSDGTPTSARLSTSRFWDTVVPDPAATEDGQGLRIAITF